MSPGLSYVVIKSHSLMADLLTPEQMRALAQQETLELFVEQLAGTSYGRISTETDGDVSLALEKVFYQKFIERMMGIVDLAPTNIGDFLQSYYYLRFEAINLKRIVRGKFSGLPTSKIIDFLIPITPYRVESYEKIAGAETLHDAVRQLEGTQYEPLVSSLELSEKYDALWPVEIALNYLSARGIFKSLERLPQSDRGLVRRIVQAEADVENFLVAAKQRGARENAHSPEEMFPTTYDISLDMLREAMETDDLRAVIQGLNPPYNEILTPLYEGDVALIRSRLRQHVYDIARRGRAANDFGFNVVMAYLVFSEIEKNDLVGIAWGKTQGIAAEDMLKYLTIPNYP
ncbi:V-type ATPase subunit [Candidatus Bathyarchaeota archaeon]|nr:V-type ATPase subunit [Candidatus Bathyarchaeota archaeon]MBL7079355.1 V-type ATPase subunit [Candidatus Bathyarchaeota archaeon]